MFSLSYWARFYFADSRGNSWIFTAQLAWALDFPVVTLAIVLVLYFIFVRSRMG